MKKIVFALLLSVPFSLQAAQLVPEKGVKILFVNGQEVESRISVSEILPGFNQIVLRMDTKVSKNDLYTSKPYIVSLDVTGDVVTINHPVARSVQEAERAFRADNPKWLVEQDGTALGYTQEVLQGREGFMPYAKMDQLIAEQNKRNGIYFENGQLVDKPVAVKAAATTAVVESSNVTAESNVELVATDNVNQLKAWYLKSSKEERKTFRKWMIDQE